jgi:inorganic triphosphatase YgiF
MSDLEQELKLVPRERGLLDRLAAIERLGDLAVTGRRHERQHNSFFDSASGSLGAKRLGFRRRTIDGERLASWTLKGEGEHLQGIATRTEIELQLDPDLAPALASGALRDAARSRGAAAWAEEIDEALSHGLPRKTPFLETRTDRRIVDLVDRARGAEVELALDEVHLLGHAYQETEIEAELKRGSADALSMARAAIEALGEVDESEGSKLSRAAAHVAHCAGC